MSAAFLDLKRPAALKTIGVRLPPADLATLTAVATAASVKPSALARRVLMEFIEQLRKDAGRG